MGKYITITLGEKGSISTDLSGTIYKKSALEGRVYDTMSTGDAFALSSPILSLTESLDLSTELGHVASVY